MYIYNYQHYGVILIMPIMSRYGNGRLMHVILNGEPLEEVDCFKYLHAWGRNRHAADGGCGRNVVHRMNREV